MRLKVVYAEIPEELKYRLDRYAFDKRIKIREAVIEILEKALPYYEEYNK